MRISGSKILVTGGAGFIGSHIVESLVQLGAKVTVFDNFSTGRMENLQAVQDKIEIIKDDILDKEALLSAFRGQDCISHQAAQLEIFLSTDNPFFDLNVNTIGTMNVLEAAEKCGVKKLMNASSACVYGQVEGLTDENFDPRPNWNYGVSKLAAEKYGFIYNDYHNLPVISLRYGIVYGEREWYRRVLTIFIKRVINNESPVVFGDGLQIRDFVYVGDVVRMHNLCLENEEANGKVYNVGTGLGTSVKDLADAVIKASDRDLNTIFEDTKEGEFSKLVPDKKRNTQELKMMMLDPARAREQLGWVPEVSLLEGVKREMKWAENNIARWDKVFYSK